MQARANSNHYIRTMMTNTNTTLSCASQAGTQSTSIFTRIRSLFLGLTTLLLATGMMITSPAQAAPGEQDTKAIEYLIDYVSQSDMTFVRNFSEYTPERAAEHIRAKYEHFMDKIDGPEKFIELSATKSLMAGRDYRVITPDGNTLKTGEWLLGALADYREKQNLASSQ